MARIRSVHPGLFTDETFVALSPAAQIFWIGLWCEADDRGVFEWKPMTLKMRLIPASDGRTEPLLDELAQQGLIRRYEADGRAYGGVRNFCRHQRPKSPKVQYPAPPEILTFVAAEGDDMTGPMAFSRDLTAAERKRRQRQKERDEGEERHGNGGTRHGSAVTHSEMSRQMEDGGGSRREDKQRSTTPLRDRAFYDRLEAALRDAASLEGDPSPKLADISPILGLMDGGLNLESHILPSLRAAAKAGKRGRSWQFYVPIIQESVGARSRASGLAQVVAPKAASPISDEIWNKAVENYKRTKNWPFGRDSLPPDDPATTVPARILAAHGYVRAAA